MSNMYPGVVDGKRAAIKLTVSSLELLSPDFYHAPHIYFGGYEASDAQLSVEKYNVNINNINIAEKNVATIRKLKNNLPHQMHDCLYHGDILDMIREKGICGQAVNGFIDLCGNLSPNDTDLIQECLSCISRKGVAAITTSYGHDAWAAPKRQEIKSTLSKEFSDSEHWKPIAQVKLLTEYLARRGEKWYFPFAISYTNTNNDSRPVATPMVVAIGYRSNWSNVPEPHVFLHLARGGVVDYKRTSTKHASLRGAIPQSFKDFLKQTIVEFSKLVGSETK